MLGFLFIILLIGSLYFVFHFKKEMFLQKRQLILLKHINDDLKYKISNENTVKKAIDIIFIIPTFNTATIAEKCILYLSPMEDSPILLELDKNTEVAIEDSAKIDNVLWYEAYVTLQNSTRIKGWIFEQYILPK